MKRGASSNAANGSSACAPLAINSVVHSPQERFLTLMMTPRLLTRVKAYEGTAARTSHERGSATWTKGHQMFMGSGTWRRRLRCTQPGFFHYRAFIMQKLSLIHISEP